VAHSIKEILVNRIYLSLDTWPQESLKSKEKVFTFDKEAVGLHIHVLH
jgi:hypothetical protein